MNDESFDVVVSMNVFHAFPDKQKAFHETWRVLKSGGKFIACFYIKGKSKRTDWLVKNSIFLLCEVMNASVRYFDYKYKV